MCRFSSEKMYTYIRGSATGANMHEALKVLTFARKQHEGQIRKSGEPFIVHPLTMACNALSLGIRDDEVIATILLHDVCEDCNVSIIMFSRHLPFSRAGYDLPLQDIEDTRVMTH